MYLNNQKVIIIACIVHFNVVSKKSTNVVSMKKLVIFLKKIYSMDSIDSRTP